MGDQQPTESELLAFVEGELDPEAAARVRRAIDASPELARAVAELEEARAALRAAPPFGLPAERLRAMLAELPAQEERRSSGWLAWLTSSPRRIVAVAVPVAAVLAVAIAVTTTIGRNDREQVAGEAPAAATVADAAASERAAEAPAEAPPPAEAAPATTAPLMEAAKAPVVSVAGPPSEVARLLRAAGLDARVVAGQVEARGATEEAVRQALRGRAGGSVAVVLAGE